MFLKHDAQCRISALENIWFKEVYKTRDWFLGWSLMILFLCCKGDAIIKYEGAVNI
jgi:hypothetical protein